MGFGQILQVVLSLGVVALALYLSARMARRRLGPAGEESLRVLSRQSVSKTQNLVVVEANGHRHLIALTDGGAHTVQTWDAPVEEVAAGPRHAAPRDPARPALALPTLSRPALSRPALPRPALPRPALPRPAWGRPTLARAARERPATGRRAKATGPASDPVEAPATAAPEAGSFAARLAALQAQTQWAPLGQRK